MKLKRDTTGDVVHTGKRGPEPVGCECQPEQTPAEAKRIAEHFQYATVPKPKRPSQPKRGR